MHILTSSEVSI